jgi:hypothetical protein
MRNQKQTQKYGAHSNYVYISKNKRSMKFLRPLVHITKLDHNRNTDTVINAEHLQISSLSLLKPNCPVCTTRFSILKS